ncbi:hypothetical protein ACM26V_02400 [Salipaludibacillus sp. HK11]
MANREVMESFVNHLINHVYVMEIFREDDLTEYSHLMQQLMLCINPNK